MYDLMRLRLKILDGVSDTVFHQSSGKPRVSPTAPLWSLMSKGNMSTRVKGEAGSCETRTALHWCRGNLSRQPLQILKFGAFFYNGAFRQEYIGHRERTQRAVLKTHGIKCTNILGKRSFEIVSHLVVQVLCRQQDGFQMSYIFVNMFVRVLHAWSTKVLTSAPHQFLITGCCRFLMLKMLSCKNEFVFWHWCCQLVHMLSYSRASCVWFICDVHHETF